MVSLEVKPYDITVWKLSHIRSPLFRVFCDESSLDPMDTTSLVTSFSISLLQLSSQYYSYDPSPMSQFHLMPGQPCHHTLNKGSLSPLYSPCPWSPIQCVSSQIVPHICLSPFCFQLRKHYCLGQLHVSLCRRQHIYSRGQTQRSMYPGFINLIDEFLGPLERSPYCLSGWLCLTCSTSTTSSHR